MPDNDVTVRPLLPVTIFLVVSMIWFSYTDKLYIKMLGIIFSPQKYHHHQQFLFKFKDNNENDMTPKGHFEINWPLGTPASEVCQFLLDLQVDFWGQGSTLNTIATSKLALNEKLWKTWPNRFVNIFCKEIISWQSERFLSFWRKQDWKVFQPHSTLQLQYLKSKCDNVKIS